MCAAAVSAVLGKSPVDHVSALAGIHAAAGHMLVRIKMILAVFVVSLALGTEAENKIRVVEFCPAADGAFMAARFSCCLGGLFRLCFKIMLPLDLLRVVFSASGHGEIHDEVQKGHENCHAGCRASEDKPVNKVCPVKKCQPLGLDGNHEK